MELSQEILGIAERKEVDNTGRVVLRFGFLVTIYFRDGFSERVRAAVLDCFNEYLALFRGELKWWVVEGRRFGRTDALAREYMSRYLLSDRFSAEGTDLNWAFLWHGGDREDDSSDYQISGFGASRMATEDFEALSYLSVVFPITVAAERWDSLEAMVLRWLRRLCPVHGYGGIGILESPDEGVAATNEWRVVGMARRHPGAEVDHPLVHALFLKQNIKGGNWITVLGDAFVAKLGALTGLQANLPAAFRLIPYDCGAVIIAGPVPELGDVTQRIGTPNYRSLARILKPIRIATHPGIAQSPGGFDREKFEAWLSRFDEEQA